MIFLCVVVWVLCRMLIALHPQDFLNVLVQASCMATVMASNKQRWILRNVRGTENQLIGLAATEGTGFPSNPLTNRSSPIAVVCHRQPPFHVSVL